MAEYKRRVTHYIRVMERRVGGLQKNVEDWTTEYTNWSSEAQRLEGLRGELTPNWPLPQRESALWHARERAVAAQERRDWYEGDLKKAEVDLERYRQFRISLDLQTRYSKKTAKD